MGKIALSLKIDLAKMDMKRIFNGKNGAQYLDATIFVNMDELDQYGNSGMITQDVSKEEKQQGVKGNILGNGKVFWVENGQAPQQQGQAQGGYQQAPQSQGGYSQQAPQQAPQQGGFTNQGQVPQQQHAPQQQAAYNPGDGFNNNTPPF